MKKLPDDYIAESNDFYLRPITVEDTENVLNWRNSEFVVSEFFYRYEITADDHMNWLKTKVFTGEVVQLVVVLKEGDVPVGSVYLQHYLPEQNAIEAGIFMSPSAPKGIGLGRRAFEVLVKKVGLEDLGVDTVYTRVIADNIPSNKMNQRIGFKEESREMCKIVPGDIEVECVNYVIHKY